MYVSPADCVSPNWWDFNWSRSPLHRPVSIRVRGKGRKERSLPLWKETTTDLRAWLVVRGTVRVPEVFVNAEGLRNDTGRVRIRYSISIPAPVPPDVRGWWVASVSPHQLRHSCAVIMPAGHPRHPQSRLMARPRRCAHNRNLPAAGIRPRSWKQWRRFCHPPYVGDNSRHPMR